MARQDSVHVWHSTMGSLYNRFALSSIRDGLGFVGLVKGPELRAASWSEAGVWSCSNLFCTGASMGGELPLWAVRDLVFRYGTDRVCCIAASQFPLGAMDALGGRVCRWWAGN